MDVLSHDDFVHDLSPFGRSDMLAENPSPNSRHNPQSSSSPIYRHRCSDTGAWTLELPCSASLRCPLLSRASSSAAAAAYAVAPSDLAQLPCPPCLPPKSPLFHPQNRFFFLPLRLLLARDGDTSSALPPAPEEARGKQQWLALCLRHLRCAWAYAPVAASAMRQSQRRRKGIPFAASAVLLESLLFGPLLTSLIKKQNNMAKMLQCTVIPTCRRVLPGVPSLCTSKSS
ncbi:uncharacterized protein LOC119272574 [Triticum dicoccoides]|uniref:uncharacterized protein LOC119272574 n=1 Tax=Triticum dicoccoides TaxID=85692 RepID=UPI00188EDF3F|nr:uncharacterized protein LOC119272574 [Triticum dicoccoides]